MMVLDVYIKLGGGYETLSAVRTHIYTRVVREEIIYPLCCCCCPIPHRHLSAFAWLLFVVYPCTKYWYIKKTRKVFFVRSTQQRENDASTHTTPPRCDQKKKGVISNAHQPKPLPGGRRRREGLPPEKVSTRSIPLKKKNPPNSRAHHHHHRRPFVARLDFLRTAATTTACATGIHELRERTRQTG